MYAKILLPRIYLPVSVPPARLLLKHREHDHNDID